MSSVKSISCKYNLPLDLKIYAHVSESPSASVSDSHSELSVAAPDEVESVSLHVFYFSEQGTFENNQTYFILSLDS